MVAITLLRILAASLLSLPLVLVVGARPSATTVASNPVGVHLNPVPFSYHDYPRDTNANRLKRGLGPKPPVLRRKNRALVPRQSPAPLQTGYIQVAIAPTTGFVGAATNEWGEYVMAWEQSEALHVVLHENGQVGEKFDITSLNGIAALPPVGFIEGEQNTSPDLSAGSSNYAYLGGVTSTPPGSPPQALANSYTDATGIAKHVESAIWELQPGNQLAIRWVNTDGSIPNVGLFYVPVTGGFIITSNRDKFIEEIGDNALPVTFTFVPL
ncbi:hypothetical protein BXZ70DRAFT_1004740 [Cristinia sonorae]|uniref:Uncharacterized protein n=1 Tax=Cristinia sonorae TaxID=1940300 RepID=A0A8K0UWG1_9AGAR|nr:hypothetical protein BXZ70DRAFT_1004740 [Cristinia sonorae]